jgi:hypothetical protein
MNGKTARLIARAASRAKLHDRPLRKGWPMLSASEKHAMRRDMQRFIDGAPGTLFGAMAAERHAAEARAGKAKR